jgi:hypothetical protein
VVVGQEDDQEDRDWLYVLRRALAARLVRELVSTPPHRLRRDGLTSMVAVEVTLESAPQVAAALAVAARAARDGPGDEVEFAGGPGGEVVALHGVDWSVVFCYLPFTGLVLVCLNDVAEHCLQVYDDSPDAQTLVTALFEAVIQRLGRAASVPDGSGGGDVTG